MRDIAKGKAGKGPAVYAFLLVAFSCVLGLSFCLIKSPQARSEAYLATAVQAMEHNQTEPAASAALEAVRLNPMAPQGWRILSRLLQQKGNQAAAKYAQSIASRLQQNPDSSDPVYAMPAEFKLSLLALGEPGIR